MKKWTPVFYEKYYFLWNQDLISYKMVCIA